ncbi:Hypothetical predicted protein [Paramuricea clavata]|uniref:Uncharacterized protein n=1 Tax=Paramuricea clavata TaxID=317549 RepID=A0A7D9EDU7_PARCT|nr:Hypothetical predicted protein [Paramuricea clavata]
MQRKRHYRCKVKCKSFGIQMNSDHFAKHNHNKHEGRAYSPQIVEGNQTTISFAIAKMDSHVSSSSLCDMQAGSESKSHVLAQSDNFSSTAVLSTTNKSAQIVEESCDIIPSNLEDTQEKESSKDKLPNFEDCDYISDSDTDKSGECSSTESCEDSTRRLPEDIIDDSSDYDGSDPASNGQGDQNAVELWQMCIAEVKILASNAQECSIVVQQALSSEIVYPEELLPDVLGAISKVNDITLARQQLAFPGHDESDGNFVQIVNLVARHNAQLKSWLSDRNLKPYAVKYLSPHSQNEFIVVAVRYLDEENSPTERVLEMTEAIDKTGEGQAKEILESLESGISSTDGLVYQSYDYTASMSGVYNGAQKCLQDKQNLQTGLSLERSAAESGKCSETSESVEDPLGLQIRIH